MVEARGLIEFVAVMSRIQPRATWGGRRGGCDQDCHARSGPVAFLPGKGLIAHMRSAPHGWLGSMAATFDEVDDTYSRFLSFSLPSFSSVKVSERINILQVNNHHGLCV